VDELCVACEAVWMKCSFAETALHVRAASRAAVDGDFVSATRDDVNARIFSRDQSANSK
jgi:hypothetical protein